MPFTHEELIRPFGLHHPYYPLPFPLLSLERGGERFSNDSFEYDPDDGEEDLPDTVSLLPHGMSVEEFNRRCGWSRVNYNQRYHPTDLTRADNCNVLREDIPCLQHCGIHTTTSVQIPRMGELPYRAWPVLTAENVQDTLAGANDLRIEGHVPAGWRHLTNDEDIQPYDIAVWQEPGRPPRMLMVPALRSMFDNWVGGYVESGRRVGSLRVRFSGCAAVFRHPMVGDTSNCRTWSDYSGPLSYLTRMMTDPWWPGAPEPARPEPARPKVKLPPHLTLSPA